jgi:L,D-transpeptidase ErfK/SrfK
MTTLKIALCSIIALCALAPGVSGAGRPQPATTRVLPLAGEATEYTAKSGETLYRIARKNNVSLSGLMALNGLSSRRVKAGTKLLLPTLHILPRVPHEGIVLNIPERRVYVFKNGSFLARYPVAVGRPSWPTTTGEYQLRSKIIDPTWTPPSSMVKREGVKDEPVPPGPENPLGDRWMGWTAPGFGFHSTTSPSSIGSAASHGCVRLYPESARRMFEQVTVGMPIYSVYEPVLIGKRDGKYYLSVAPDVYGRGGASLEDVKKALEAVGLLPLVNEAKLRGIASQKDAYPHPIVGADETIEVNGKPVDAPVRPTLLPGSWVVPARAVAEALGGTVKTAEDGTVQILYGERSLVIKLGDEHGTLAGQAITLLPVPTVAEDTLMLPLRPLMELFGATFVHDKGRAIQLTTTTSPSR